MMQLNFISAVDQLIYQTLSELKIYEKKINLLLLHFDNS